MATALAVIWFGSALGGLLALLTAAAVPSVRFQALVVATALFMVAGILGILSVGVVFIALAALCGVLAGRASSGPGPDLADG